MKRLILAALMTLAIPQQVMAANDQAAAGVNTPQVTRTTAATPASPPDATTPSGTPTAPAAGDPLARDLQPIVVSVPRPHIWTFRKGASTVLVLGMVYPEPEGLTYVPGSIHHAIAQSGAVIGPPWFHFTANVNLINVWSIWHAASGAKYLPDGKHLADILSPSELAQWNALKARYKPGGNVDRMRPMYAGWKLYEAVLKHSGVAVDASVYKLITDDARKRGIPMIDAQFHWARRARPPRSRS